jgi:23S rRNA pseudouridine1911/1915/1917 synthase
MDNKIWQSKIIISQIEKRLDKFLVENFPEKSRSYITKLIKDEFVLCNGSNTKASYKLKLDDSISVAFPKLKDSSLEPFDIPLVFFYEDDYMAVIEKPPMIPVHTGAGINTPTLVNGLLFHCKNLSGIGGVLRPGIVHRLDKETSGVMIVAKNDYAHNRLSNQFKERKVKKSYFAIVYGVPDKDEGIIDFEIGRDKNNRVKISNNSRSLRKAETRWRISRRFNNYSLIEAFPLTGRTHQIRVHLDLIGHPVVGDKVYGKGFAGSLDLELKKVTNRHLLHAGSIEFAHPASGEIMKITSEIPDDFNKFIDVLGDHE